MLRGLGLLFTHRAQHGDQANVDKYNILPPYEELELSERLQEDHGLDVADCATNLTTAIA